MIRLELSSFARSLAVPPGATYKLRSESAISFIIVLTVPSPPIEIIESIPLDLSSLKSARNSSRLDGDLKLSWLLKRTS